MTELYTVAKARTGDKGDDSIVGLYCANEADFAVAKNILSKSKIAEHFNIRPNQVSVTPLPGLLAFTVLITEVLEGGVTRSLRSDPHGKTLGSYLLELNG